MYKWILAQQLKKLLIWRASNLKQIETFVSGRDTFVTLPMDYGKSNFFSKNNENIIRFSIIALENL